MAAAAPTPPRVHTLHTWNVYRVSRDGKEKGERKKKKKSIWFHSSLTRSLTDCDLPPLNKGKETAWPQRRKNASEWVLTVLLQLTCLKKKQESFALTTGAHLSGLICATRNSKAHRGSGFNRSLACSLGQSCTEIHETTGHGTKNLKSSYVNACY